MKTRETPSAGLRYVVALTLHNHAIINTNHSWSDKGRMIHRRDTIAQRATRVEFRDKGESAPRRAHATGIFRLSWNLYTIKPPPGSFSHVKIEEVTSRLLPFITDVYRDDKLSQETRRVYSCL